MWFRGEYQREGISFGQGMASLQPSLGVRADGVGKERSSYRRYEKSSQDFRQCAGQLSL
jgi:hypothetical protein